MISGSVSISGVPCYQNESYANKPSLLCRLPYVDNGWVDEDAAFGKQVARFFGFGRKKKDEGEKGTQGK